MTEKGSKGLRSVLKKPDIITQSPTVCDMPRRVTFAPSLSPGAKLNSNTANPSGQQQRPMRPAVKHGDGPSGGHQQLQQQQSQRKRQQPQQQNQQAAMLQQKRQRTKLNEHVVELSQATRRVLSVERNARKERSDAELVLYSTWDLCQAAVELVVKSNEPAFIMQDVLNALDDVEAHVIEADRSTEKDIADAVAETERANEVACGFREAHSFVAAYFGEAKNDEDLVAAVGDENALPSDSAEQGEIETSKLKKMLKDFEVAFGIVQSLKGKNL